MKRAYLRLRDWFVAFMWALVLTYYVRPAPGPLSPSPMRWWHHVIVILAAWALVIGVAFAVGGSR